MSPNINTDVYVDLTVVSFVALHLSDTVFDAMQNGT